MRIGSRIFIVGAIPIVIAACIALAAILLLVEANRARSGAALAGTVYRTLQTAVMARNDYLHETPTARLFYEQRFFDLTKLAGAELDRLATLAPADRLTADAAMTLAHYSEDMRTLVRVTRLGDQMVGTMDVRAAFLIALTDQARERQHASNADIIVSLTESDAKLRTARDIVDAAYATRLALGSIQSEMATEQTAMNADMLAKSRRTLSFDGVRLNAVAGHLMSLQAGAYDLSGGASTPDQVIPSKIAAVMARLDSPEAAVDPDSLRAVQELEQWAERILKIYSAEYRSLHEQSAQLLTYSVQAHDTELATQNIAIEILKLRNQSAAALARRDEDLSRTIVKNSHELSDSIAALPISPLIQTEMIDAFDQWHDGLQSATTGIKQQNDLIKDMDGAADAMIEAARSLDASLSANAERTARSIQAILVSGAVTGLLLGGGVAYVVARSITTPLAELKARITHMAQDQGGGLIEDALRRDELGDIARATNVFLVEIARRERAIRKSKELADTTLDTLRQTQAELIQAEKLASLGQLVAGVAHEINTPIGIALTTSSVVEEEIQQFRLVASQKGISRAALDRLIERVSEGAGLLMTNLTRAADLIQSFKHVAADQVSGERREFEVETFLHRLLTSLGPMLRKTGHQVITECPAGLVLDSYPGALAQVVTNLVVNASVHAFPEGQVGSITVSVRKRGPDAVRFVIDDTGQGISAEHRSKIFDPFFTTRRAKGSTGLGLHIVFNLVTSTLQGRIDLDSVPGRGSRFIVDLPRVASAARTPPIEQEALS